MLAWIKAWLSGRKQRVVLNGEESSWQSVLSGVPQGSVLGPILFIIFINDIDAVTSDSSFTSKFADDTKSALIVENEEDQATMQANINSLSGWAEKWQMEFNSDKCHIMHLGRNNQRFSYTMGGHAPAGTVLGCSEQEKDLGVIIHESLKPSKQCAAAAKKAHSVLGQMARSLTYRTSETWLRLYRMYVRHHLEYCVQAWAPWTAAEEELLESVQKRAVRMTSGLSGATYEDKLKEVGMMSLAQRRQRGDMIEVWKLLNGHEKVDVTQILSLAGQHCERSTRSVANRGLVQTASKLDLRKNFFANRVVTPWNKLDPAVRHAKTIDAFKARYDKIILGLD